MQQTYEISCAACADYAPQTCRAALKDVLAPLGALDWVRPGMKIGIKANLVSAIAPDRAATTHPQLIAALCALLRERGASAVVGDSPGGLFTEAYLDFVYRASGLKQTVGDLLNHDTSQREVTYLDAVAAKKFPYTAWLDGCDAIINFCKLKTHGMMALSAGVKNLFGVIPGTKKPELHFLYPNPDTFADMLVDLYEFTAPRLTICDAVVAMEGNGPTQGTPHPLGCLLAAPDAHRLDLLCAHMIGLAPDEVPTLAAAIRRGLCPNTVDALAVAGDWRRFVPARFETIPAASGIRFENTLPGFAGRAFGRLAQACLAARPSLTRESCTGCAKCAGVCPAHAITMKQKRPVIDRGKCIRCFCCQEFCPQGAMRTHRPAVARLLTR